MSLRDLGQRVDKTPSYLSDIENDRRVPAEALIRDLADVLDLEVDSLLALGGRITADTEQYIKRHPAAMRLINVIAENDLSEDEIIALIRSCDDLLRERSTRSSR